MASPVGIHQVSWFYPLGNTPAYSLTQDLAPESDAGILSLGCGDIRHVLFTSHLEPSRSIAITCVDNNIAIIARNVFMFSLILEGKDNWEIYHHTKISQESLDLIHEQAQKLQNFSWEGRIQFLDKVSLQKVKEVWKTYATTPNMKAALEMRKHFFGDQSMDLGLFRATAPLQLFKFRDVLEYDDDFWKIGCVEGNANRPNPLFGSQSIMHYGTQPLAGYHLALASGDIEGGTDNLVATAKAEFSTWASSFRRSKTTVKYCWSDALSFAYAVQGFSGYRDHYHAQSLTLEHQNFDIIDTSNLADYIGALNIMVAVSPLLKQDGLLRTQLLVQKEEPTKVLKNMLHGDLDTVSAILGLSLLEHCTNASAASNIDTLLLQAVINNKDHFDAKKPQLLLKFTWKAVPSIVLEAVELAEILHLIYRSMFQSESISKSMGSTMLQMAMKGLDFPHFHRGSLAHLLRAAQPSSDNWRLTIARFLHLIQSDSDIMMTYHYLQELSLQLYIFNLHTTELLENPSIIQNGCPPVQQIWPNLPAAVWITIKIPTSRIELFKVSMLKSAYGSLPVVGMIERRSQSQQDFFSVLQMVFGTIRTSGSKDTLIVKIDEDDEGWKSKAPMIVSFRVPSWTLLVEGKKTTVSFGLQSTTYTTRVMLAKLGMEMKIFTTTLDDAAHVFVSKNPPNLTIGENTKSSIYLARGEGTVRGEIRDKKLKRMVAHIRVSDDKEKSDLLAGSKVTTYRINPWEYKLEFAGHGHDIVLPAPASPSNYKTCIARKSGYLELVAHVANTKDHAETSPFPIGMKKHGCTLINMPRVGLDDLPTLDLKIKPEWLNSHTAMSFSVAEKKLREAGLASSGSPRVDFKESLFSLFMRASGAQGQTGCLQLHSLNNEASGGMAIVILVEKLRLDLSNQTVLLDAAILPVLKSSSSEIPSLLGSWLKYGINQIKVSDRELELWKQVLPVYIERCRTWSHAEECEVKKSGKVPLTYASNEAFFCTCGNGKFPKDYLGSLPDWSKMAPSCVRVAISPCFAIPYVEEMIDIDAIKKSINKCSYCKERDASGNKSLKECGRCRAAKYCSRECQKKDWPKHKKVCRFAR